ncbi:MAG: CHAP domain-containing protein [Alphaproteobacteria bacterium]
MTEKKPPGSKFTADPNADTPAVEAAVDNPQASTETKISAAFNQAAGAWDKDYNIFFILRSFTPPEYKRLQEKAPQALAEYRQMMGRGTNRQPLSETEITELKEIRAQAEKDVAAHKGLTLEVAESLGLAAKAAGVDHDLYLTRLLDTNGNLCGIDPNHLTKAGPFKFDPKTWIYMIKAHGAEHGLGYFADQIKMEDGPGGTKILNVEDPTVLREIMDLRNNPRMSAVMGAELVKDENQLPAISYKGVNMVPDPALLKQQQQFMKLGFDVGLKGADGVNGPLTIAAQKEFMHMYSITDPAQLQAKIDAVLKQAEDLKTRAQRAVDAYNGVHPKTTKAADGTETTADPNSPSTKVTTAQAFGMLVASERTKVKVDHLLEVAIAERAFEPGKPNRNRSPGLYQMTDGQWLTTVARHGAAHGLADLVKHMDVKKDKQGNISSVTIQDPLIRQYILNLRKDPRVSAMMTGEHCKEYPVYLDVAQCYLGETKNTDFADINRFLKREGFDVDVRNTSWCAAFVNSVLEGVGIDGNDKLNARSFLDGYGTKVAQKDVQAGDIVVIPRGTEAWQGHVAMVLDKYQAPNGQWRVHVIGGNQGSEGGGSVCIHDWPMSLALGYVRPPEADILVAANAATQKFNNIKGVSAPAAANV